MYDNDDDMATSTSGGGGGRRMSTSAAAASVSVSVSVSVSPTPLSNSNNNIQQHQFKRSASLTTSTNSAPQTASSPEPMMMSIQQQYPFPSISTSTSTSVLSPPSTSSSQILMSGYLQKLSSSESSNIPFWKRRYMVLTGDSLYAFRSNADLNVNGATGNITDFFASQSPVGKLDLDDSSQAFVAEDGLWVIEVRTAILVSNGNDGQGQEGENPGEEEEEMMYRRWSLQCAGKDDMMDWLNCLKKVIKSLKATGGGTFTSNGKSLSSSSSSSLPSQYANTTTTPQHLISPVRSVSVTAATVPTSNGIPITPILTVQRPAYIVNSNSTNGGHPIIPHPNRSSSSNSSILSPTTSIGTSNGTTLISHTHSHSITSLSDAIALLDELGHHHAANPIPLAKLSLSPSSGELSAMDTTNTNSMVSPMSPYQHHHYQSQHGGHHGNGQNHLISPPSSPVSSVRRPSASGSFVGSSQRSSSVSSITQNNNNTRNVNVQLKRDPSIGFDMNEMDSQYGQSQTQSQPVTIKKPPLTLTPYTTASFELKHEYPNAVSMSGGGGGGNGGAGNVGVMGWLSRSGSVTTGNNAAASGDGGEEGDEFVSGGGGKNSLERRGTKGSSGSGGGGGGGNWSAANLSSFGVEPPLVAPLSDAKKAKLKKSAKHSFVDLDLDML
ncbi:hypothetical protein HDU76_009353 [Blyttiomyces sp. JEL0837]|nr:hypothetical protein HDU76_009353 [Blyttiomyces sp. JEL0837]